MKLLLTSKDTIVSLDSKGKTDYLKIWILGDPLPKASLKIYFNRVIAQLVHYEPKQPEIPQLNQLLKENLGNFLEEGLAFFEKGSHVQVQITFLIG